MDETNKNETVAIRVINGFAVPGRGFTKDSVEDVTPEEAARYIAQGNAEVFKGKRPPKSAVEEATAAVAAVGRIKHK